MLHVDNILCYHIQVFIHQPSDFTGMQSDLWTASLMMVMMGGQGGDTTPVVWDDHTTGPFWWCIRNVYLDF